MMIDPLFENMRDDPEFLAIYHRVQKEKALIREQVSEVEKQWKAGKLVLD